MQPRSFSWAWQAILGSANILKKDCKWYVANDQCVRILEDLWIFELSLVVDTIVFDTSAIVLGAKTIHFITSVWKWDTIRLGTVFHS